MPGEDDRARPRLREEGVEGGGKIAISEVQRLVGGGLGRQECAECRLAIARCPDLAAGVERAGLRAQEQFGAGIGLGIVQRREEAWARGAAAAPRAPLLERLWWWLRRTMILVVYAAFAGACLGFAFGGRSGDRRGGWDEL